MLQLFIHTLYLFTATQQLKFDELGEELGVKDLEYRLKTGRSELTFEQTKQWLFWLQQRKGNPHIGLQIGHFSDFSQIGMIGCLMQTCKTIRESTNLAIQWMEISNPYFRIEVEEDHKQITIKYLSDTQFAREHPKMAEQALQMFLSTVYFGNNKLIVEERIPLTGLTFTCQPPADTTYFEKMFGIRPKFGAAQNSLSFYKEWYDHSVRSHNKEVFELLNKRFEAQIEAVNSRYTSKLSKKIKTDIATALRALSDIGIEDIAEIHGLSTRVIQRILKSENTSFRQLRKDVREELSLTLLQDKSVPIKEISYLLGYAGMSAFSKAFKRWKGMSPSEYQSG